MLFFKSNDYHKTLKGTFKKKMVTNRSILIFPNPNPRLEYSKIIKEKEKERKKRIENESHKIFHHFHGVNS